MPAHSLRPHRKTYNVLRCSLIRHLFISKRSRAPLRALSFPLFLSLHHHQKLRWNISLNGCVAIFQTTRTPWHTTIVFFLLTSLVVTNALGYASSNPNQRLMILPTAQRRIPRVNPGWRVLFVRWQRTQERRRSERLIRANVVSARSRSAFSQLEETIDRSLFCRSFSSGATRRRLSERGHAT